MLPGTLPSGLRVYITSRRSFGFALLAFVADGGFDPLAIAAESGDTLMFSVERLDGTKQALVTVVPARAPPLVLRMAPVPHAQEVPLNANIYVVFSEPYDARVLTAGAIRLLRGGTPVNGSLHFRDWYGCSVEFVPDEPLDVGAAFELEITAAAVDRGGTPLATPVRTEFTTMAAPAASVPVIDSFSVFEQLSGDSTHWWYAPQIHVTETSGKGSVDVYRLEVTIPGAGTLGPFCSTGMLVGAGQGRSLVNEIYGSWEIEMSSSTRAVAGSEATAVVWYRDETGRVASLSARGPVVPGGEPTTYTGGKSSMAPGACVFP
jgi:hypothetical protein